MKALVLFVFILAAQVAVAENPLVNPNLNQNQNQNPIPNPTAESEAEAPCLFGCDLTSDPGEKKETDKADADKSGWGAYDPLFPEEESYVAPGGDDNVVLFGTDSQANFTQNPTGGSPDSVGSLNDYLANSPYGEEILNGANFTDLGVEKSGPDSTEASDSVPEDILQLNSGNVFVGASVNELQQSIFGEVNELTAANLGEGQKNNVQDALADYQNERDTQRNIINNNNVKKHKQGLLY